MAGLSTVLYDTGSIVIAADAAGDTATAISGDTVGGRALSATAHPNTAGVRRCQIEVVALRSTTNQWGIGVVRGSGDLGVWVGGGSDSGFWWRRISQIERFFVGSPTSVHGESAGAVGCVVDLWIDCGDGKVWVSASDRNGYRYGDDALGPPSGTPSWTVPGTGDLHIALSPVRGSSGNANVLRFRSRHHQLNGPSFGALPWDARTITLSGTLNPAHITAGEELYWAWFDHANPSAITTAPTSTGTITASAGPSYEVNAITSLDPAGVGSLLLMKTNGTPIACRSHYAPVVTP